jgi:recombination protein RecA
MPMIASPAVRPSPARPAVRPATLRWTLRHLTGRVVEISGDGGTCVLTFAAGLIRDAQHCGEPAAWIARPDSVFFPPDVADAGVDLDSLIVIRAPGPAAALRAADHLLRSGAFGLVVVDLGEDEAPLPLLARLAGMVRRHRSVLLFLSERPSGSASLGPLVSLKAECRQAHVAGDLFRCTLLVTKDKCGARHAVHTVECRGPAGLY